MNTVLINGRWRTSQSAGSIQAIDPTCSSQVGESFPTSSWDDCEAVMDAAQAAATALENLPAEVLADFLRAYADNLEKNADPICQMAAVETGLALHPRLMDVEMPRTLDQLRQAAAAATDPAWRNPVHDDARNLYSCLTPIGPVLVFGPNNFPLAFNAVAGGDFAAAIAAGNPVIAKAHPSQPGTSRMLAEAAQDAAQRVGLPDGTVQMLFDVDPKHGLKMVADPRVAAVAFTGSRRGGMALKAVADAVGKPIYLEMSSVNPVFLLPGAMRDDPDLFDKTAGSCLLGAGQFCTSPNLIVMLKSDLSDAFLNAMVKAFQEKPAGILLSKGVLETLVTSIAQISDAGAEVLTGGKSVVGPAIRFENTLLAVDAKRFLQHVDAMQTEVFGPVSLVVICENEQDVLAIANRVHGSLTASVFGSQDDALLVPLTKILQKAAGRILHNKMPTGVAVSPAMNHGGPFPATGHPRFTAVGIPAALERFAKLTCYDNVAPPFRHVCLR